MNAPSLDSAIRQIAIASIGGYQRHISPRKGFSCAHRLLYKGESCSQYAKRMIAQQGLVAAIATVRQRFRACKIANQILQARYSSQADSDRSKRERRNRNWGCNCDDYGAVDCVSGVSELSCEALDCFSEMDFASLDCGVADCGSGIDCGVADCGSCGG
ncbi:membrane protein insertion efficiency factor YidD [Trichocoleus sp. DQ-A3]|uniref:membrane protein insertion efficiency factor YidD n=1 Tax=Cyanophyceae TaxID=3028117 RepID=UPI0016820287|nr:membrane protein insertion efficiency factor YidD [Coleofasciculus sp. FACHB-125]MBD1901345.1 membrane protein insertion efficiency factor YidD [Coleofasciculus sp. FACHB-125]